MKNLPSCRIFTAVVLSLLTVHSYEGSYLTLMVPTQKIEFYRQTRLTASAAGALKHNDFLHYRMNRRFFTFLLGKSCKSGIKLRYLYARGVREFRVSQMLIHMELLK